MKVDVGVLENATVAAQPNPYVGRFVRKQGQYGTVSAFGIVAGTSVEAIEHVKRLFPRNGTVETQGILQHAGLSPGDWVAFDAVRNTRNRLTDYKVSHLRRIPRYAALTEGTEAHYRTLLTRSGWTGDKRAGLWALRISGDRVIVADLELGKDGALRLPRVSKRAVQFQSYRDVAVVRLGNRATSDDVYLDLDAGVAGTFDWSDEADHIARVIRSLSGANDPLVTDIITWLDLHHEDGRVFAATIDHEAGLDSLRSGELAARLRADRELMETYLAAALDDDAVAAAVAAYAREGHTEERARLRVKLVEEVAARRAELLAEQDVALTAERSKAIHALELEIEALRRSKLAVVGRDAAVQRQAHSAKLVDLEAEYRHRREEADGAVQAAQACLAELQNEIASSIVDRDRVLAQAVAERERLRETAGEIDRLLKVADRLATAEAAHPPGTLPVPLSSIGYAFDKGPTVLTDAVAKAIDGMALLSDKGRDLMRMLLVLTLSGEMPVLHGADATDFVRLAGFIIAPGRTGVMQADPTLVSIEDLWARPGSSAPTILAAASAACLDGVAALVAINRIESSGARFWMPALADALRGGALPRALLVCGIAGDVHHDEIKALPADAPFLNIEGAFGPGASMGALALHGLAGAEQAALQVGALPTNMAAALKVVGALGFDPGLGFALRIARMAAEASALLGDQSAAAALIVRLAQDIKNQTR